MDELMYAVNGLMDSIPSEFFFQKYDPLDLLELEMKVFVRMQDRMCVWMIILMCCFFVRCFKRVRGT